MAVFGMATASSRVDAAGLVPLLGVHEALIRRREDRLTEIAALQEKAEAVIARCNAEREKLRVELEALFATVSLIQADLRSLDEGRPLFSDQADENLIVDDGEISQKPKARLGDQHYLMLCALQNAESVSLEQVVRATRLSARRVKEQMVADVGNGVVKNDNGLLSITPKGIDLLTRFQQLKRSQGVPLPTLDSLENEGDRDEAEPETQDEEGEDA
ncbi:hypothetical protein JMJ55_26470 [Belnapia sp. T6]|uniref:Uncharacterized protein n=1 Tax=Belnapia mucosa TaxID=2804532 RepID=A0ABS1VB43_9PROT|nr:hypothetical protein [Belnapia mucosa]MBL6458878.1 hypothetical protein [Belnapia mucosa]